MVMSQNACWPTKNVYLKITADTVEKNNWCYIHTALTLLRASNMGMRTNLMKPICAVGLVTLSRSMNGATGSPSLFSRSLCKKYSSRRQSTQGSAISVGRTSLEMSHALINIFLNYKQWWGMNERDMLENYAFLCVCVFEAYILQFTDVQIFFDKGTFPSLHYAPNVLY